MKLYIKGTLADTSDDTLVQMTYTAEELSNPSVVKNAYSQSVTLPATPTNNQIFSHISRPDYLGGSDTFDPKAKSDFVILSDTGEVLEKGYLQLVSLGYSGGVVSYYSVTLYGGLGGFLYALTTKEDGEKMSLADLDYLGGENPTTELDFTINAAAVQAAWTELAKLPENRTGKWSVLNFAPCYNGLPEDFDANKGIMTDLSHNGGLSTMVEGYTVQNMGGGALGTIVTLDKEYTEWEVKDLRSYLQRPVLSWDAFINALKRFATSKGYTLDTSGLSRGFAYSGLWMTLPMISAQSSWKKDGSGTLAFSSPYTWNISGLPILPTGTNITVRLKVNPRIYLSQVRMTDLSLRYVYNQHTTYCRGAFYQLVAYNTDGDVIGGSKVGWMGANRYGRMDSISEIATRLGYTPTYTGNDALEGGQMIDGEFEQEVMQNYYKLGSSFDFEVNAANIAYVSLVVNSYQFTIVDAQLGSHSAMANGFTLYDGSTEVTPTTRTASGNGTVEYENAGGLRSGAQITKKILLTSEHTPADFLLDFVKVFGLVLTFDKFTNTISLSTRESLYYGGSQIDLRDKIDCEDMEMQPLPFATKWYDLSREVWEGQYAEEYKKMESRDYGIQRLNTGYEFDSAVTDYFSLSGALKAAAPSLERRAAFCTMKSNNIYYPAPFLQAGSKYTLWNADGQSKDIDISQVSDEIYLAALYYNTANVQYDVPGAWKMQFHDSSDKAIDGSGVLLFENGWKNYRGFSVTDDLQGMDTYNDGTPCWILSKYSTIDTDLAVPVFSTISASGTEVALSLDMGKPKSIDIPSLTYSDDASIYAQRWRRVLTDKLNDNTRVMRTKVDLRSFRVTPAMLRNFYYFGGSWWVLNKISNYDLSGDNLAECEFVKVLSPDNYRYASAPFLRLDTAAWVAPEDGGSKTINIISNEGWTITAPAWVTLSQSEGVGKAAVSLTAPANTSGATRTGTLTIESDSGIEREVTLTQSSGTVNIVVRYVPLPASSPSIYSDAPVPCDVTVNVVLHKPQTGVFSLVLRGSATIAAGSQFAVVSNWMPDEPDNTCTLQSGTCTPTTYDNYNISFSTV